MAEGAGFFGSSFGLLKVSMFHKFTKTHILKPTTAQYDMLCDECESFFSILWCNLAPLRNTLRIHFKSHTVSFENVDSGTHEKVF